MKLLMTIILGLTLSDFTFAQSSTVNPGTSPANSTTTQGDVADDQYVEKSPNADKKTFKETVVEKGHNVKRAVKKGAHKIQEMVCRKGDQKCNELKEKHRAQEEVEFHKDKLSEAQDSVQAEPEAVP